MSIAMPCAVVKVTSVLAAIARLAGWAMPRGSIGGTRAAPVDCVCTPALIYTR
jgi:hypothetical protein